MEINMHNVSRIFVSKAEKTSSNNYFRILTVQNYDGGYVELNIHSPRKEELEIKELGDGNE